jgi:hypothetical protein
LTSMLSTKQLENLIDLSNRLITAAWV